MSCYAVVLLVLVELVLGPVRSEAWGDETHRAVTHLATTALRGAAAEYFRSSADELATRSVEPDSVMRKRERGKEAVRHYINLDAYDRPPFARMSHNHRDLVATYGKKFVNQNGVLPWVIPRFVRQLRDAIQSGDRQQALREAGFLSHYVSDSFQPLHVTRNHDGQLTNNKGIHKRYEDACVDAHIREIVREVRPRLKPAGRIPDVREAVFAAMFQTHGSVGVILQADDRARMMGNPGSAAYRSALDRETRALTRNQVQAASEMIAALWETAFQDANGGR